MDRHLDRPGATLAYSTTGPDDGDRTLVIAHALTASRAYDDEWGVFDWSPVAAAGERLVRFDARGHGASTGSTVEEDYRWPSLAQDLLAIIDATAPANPVDCLGESTGCGVLLWAAVAAPHRFRRLVLVVPPTMDEARTGQAEIFLAAAALVELRGMDAWKRATAALPNTEILEAGGWVRNLDPTIAREQLVPALRGEAASRVPDDAALKALETETLVLAWATDPSHPVQSAERLHGLLSNSTLEIATSPAAIRGWGARAAEFLGSATR